MHASSWKSSAAFEQDAQNVACGADATFCKGALRSSYQNVFRSDACAIETYSAENEEQYNYNMWLPSYANKVSRGSAFLNSSNDVNRFAPKQVTQESFLQGRGQVTSNPGCKDGFLCYLPEQVFEGAAEKTKAPWDMHLFAQPTIVPRSCASLTELDLIDRLKPLAHAYQERYVPHIGQPKQTKIQEGVTLSTKKYPDFKETAKAGRYA